jgi:hypothetical protein
MEQQPDSPGDQPETPPQTGPEPDPEPEAEPRPVYDPDPEIDALLHFTPVHRHTKRRDGWPPEIQRAYIAALVHTGSAEFAAYEVGRSSGGAWSLRKAGDGIEFGESWDAAVDLWHARNPTRPRLGGRARGAWKPAPEPEPAKPPEPDEDELDPQAQFNAFRDGVLMQYLRKLQAERLARLDGRTVEADFIVRQLSWVEVVLDLAGAVPEAIHLLEGLRRGKVDVMQIAATPMSLLLDRIRRAYWADEDGPERPALPPLGDHNGDVSIGEPAHNEYRSARDGPDWKAHARRQEEQCAQRAEAERLWDEKAKADAAAWRARLERSAERRMIRKRHSGSAGASPAARPGDVREASRAGRRPLPGEAQAFERRHALYPRGAAGDQEGRQ